MRTTAVRDGDHYVINGVKRFITGADEANFAQVSNDNQKAIESYENLAKAAPDDIDVHSTLGGLYESVGAYDKARAELSKVLATDPKHVDALLASGRVEIRSANPKGSLDYLNRALTLAVQLDNQDGKATILNASGAAYEQLSKPDDALRNYEESLAIKKRLGQKAGVALTLANIARVQAGVGKPELAYKSYKEAMKLQREIGDKKGLGVTLINLGGLYSERGKYDDALTNYKEALQIQRDIGDDFIGVHIGRSAGAALHSVDDELVEVTPKAFPANS